VTLPTDITGDEFNGDPKRGYKVMILGRSLDLFVQVLKEQIFSNCFQVLDENDNKPEITVNLLPNTFHKQDKIPEETIVNTPSLNTPSGLPGNIAATTKADNNVVETGKGNGGYFSDTKMIIGVGACAGFLLLSVCLIAVFCLKFRRENNKEEDKRGSYHKPDISREDALKASEKMFHQAISNPRQETMI